MRLIIHSWIHSSPKAYVLRVWLPYLPEELAKSLFARSEGFTNVSEATGVACIYSDKLVLVAMKMDLLPTVSLA